MVKKLLQNSTKNYKTITQKSLNHTQLKQIKIKI